VFVIFILNLLLFINPKIELAKLTIFITFVREGERKFLLKLIVKHLKLLL